MKSKIKLISILVIAFITVSCTTLKNITETNVKKSNIEGVWKLIYSDLLATNLPQEMTQYKIIVDGRFFWYKIDEEGIIDMSDGAGGTYYVRDNSYTEYVEHVFPEMRSFKNTKFRTDFEVSENMLKIKGTQPNSGTVYEEVFEKVSTNKNIPEITGVWKVLNNTLNPVANKGITRYKMIVDDWFLYYNVYKDGEIVQENMTGGNLRFDDSVYVETITHYADGQYQTQLVYSSSISKFQSRGDILKIQGRNADAKEPFTEILERVVVTEKNLEF